MARILLLIFIAFLVYLVFRGLFRSATKDEPKVPEATSVKGEDMVQCTRCGVNLPRSEAREEAGRLVCQSNPHCHS
ncbi:MAG TPA: PP0621 family protein [Usitatibacter sp.]|nr:PP0621 family protein [Usitatibacter sp.]